MIGFKQHLEESRSAPLYHGTSLDNAWEILKRDILQARSHHTHKLLGFVRGKTKIAYSNDFSDSEKVVSGVSLTRSFQKAKSFGPFIFELDQIKLTHNYKILPVQYFNTVSSMAGARTSRAQALYGKPGSSSEAEEFVLGSIKNIDKYIIALHVPKGMLEYSTHPIAQMPYIKEYNVGFLF